MKSGTKGTKYAAEGAPVKKHGGNDAIHDGVVSSGPKAKKSKGKGAGS